MTFVHLAYGKIRQVYKARQETLRDNSYDIVSHCTLTLTLSI